jgi:hypothetical protein
MLFDVRGDDDGPNLMKTEPTFVAPAKESARCPAVGAPRVGIADVGCEKLEESLRRIPAGVSYQCWHREFEARSG